MFYLVLKVVAISIYCQMQNINPKTRLGEQLFTLVWTN